MKKFIPLLLVLGFLASCDLFGPASLHIEGPDGSIVDGKTLVLDAPEDFKFRLVADSGFMSSSSYDCTLTVEVTESDASPDEVSETFTIYGGDEVDLGSEFDWYDVQFEHAWATRVTVNAVDGQGKPLDPLTFNVSFVHTEWGAGADREDTGLTAWILDECAKGRGYRIKNEFWMQDYDDWYVITLTEATTLRLERVTQLSKTNLVQVVTVDGAEQTSIGTAHVGETLALDLEPGKYYIKVYNSTELSIESYAFNVTLE